MEEDLRRLRSSNVQDESMKNAKEHRLSEIEKSMKSMTKVMSTMEASISDMKAYKDVKETMKKTEENIVLMKDEVGELETTKKLKKRELELTNEKLLKAQRTKLAREAACSQALDQAQREYDDMLHSRNEATEDENRVRSDIDDIRRQNDKVASEFIKERDNVVNTYNALQKSVNQYHDRLFGVALTNAAATPHGKRPSLSDSLFGDESYVRENVENTPGLPYTRGSLGVPVPSHE
jgi:dsDNA-specific endonuclease/ATPase MutS2